MLIFEPTIIIPLDGHLKVVQYLVEIGADFRAKNNYAIRWASRNGHFNVVEHLVSVGANFSDRDNYAIKWACGIQ